MGAGSSAPQTPVPPMAKPSPPPAQMSASLKAVRNARGAADDLGDFGGTLLTKGGGVDIQAPAVRSPADVLYGKQLTGA